MYFKFINRPQGNDGNPKSWMVGIPELATVIEGLPKPVIIRTEREIQSTYLKSAFDQAGLNVQTAATRSEGDAKVRAYFASGERVTNVDVILTGSREISPLMDLMNRNSVVPGSLVMLGTVSMGKNYKDVQHNVLKLASKCQVVISVASAESMRNQKYLGFQIEMSLPGSIARARRRTLNGMSVAAHSHHNMNVLDEGINTRDAVEQLLESECGTDRCLFPDANTDYSEIELILDEVQSLSPELLEPIGQERIALQVRFSDPDYMASGAGVSAVMSGVINETVQGMTLVIGDGTASLAGRGFDIPVACTNAVREHEGVTFDLDGIVCINEEKNQYRLSLIQSV